MISFTSDQSKEMLDLIAVFAKSRILCVGDIMLDCFIEGDVKRISPESPVPVFVGGRETVVAGGAANVARNIETLGGRCTVIGIVGQDDAAKTLATAIASGGGVHPVLVTVADRPTIQKTRFVTKGHHMLRVDREETKPVNESTMQAILARVADHIADHDVLVLSDYAKGVLSDVVVRESIVLARKAGKPVIVDPKSANFARYAGATILSPNTRELEVATGMDCTEDANLLAAGRKILREAEIDALLVTRGEKGMTLLVPEEDPITVPSFAREVFDVVGAGDTVVAVLALSLAGKAPLAIGSMLANAGAGIVVGKRGTATISPDELKQQILANTASARMRGTPAMLSFEEIIEYARARKAEGKTVGFTNGVFDIVHPGHISILQFSRDACDCLIVGINSDASVQRLKGPTRPVNHERDRAIVVGAFGVVSAVTIFDEDTPIELIKAILPDVLIKGADYTVGTVVGSDVVQAGGGRVLLAPLINGASSTNIIQRAQLEKKQ